MREGVTVGQILCGRLIRIQCISVIRICNSLPCSQCLSWRGHNEWPGQPFSLRFSTSLCSSYQIGAVVNSTTALWIMPPPLNGPLKGPIFVKIWSSPPWLLNLQVSCKSSFHLFSWRRPSLWRESFFFPRLWKIPREPICRRSLFFPLAWSIFQSTTLRYFNLREIYFVVTAMKPRRLVHDSTKQ